MKNVKRVVVKVGSSTLTHAHGGLNLRKIDQLAMVLSDLQHSGIQIILVSSGAVSAGIAKLQLSKRPTLMKEKQAVASVGQCELMFIYDKFFSQYGIKIAQLLLTKAVTDSKVLRENAINTLETLLEYGVIPIINENDTIAYDEIAYGDNDTLSAISASLISADLLILLSDIDGLYDDDPSKNPNAKFLSVVEELNDNIMQMGKGAGSKYGTGGMATKLQAASIATSNKIPMIIASGEDPKILYDIFENNYRGTLFKVKEDTHESNTTCTSL